MHAIGYQGCVIDLSFVVPGSSENRWSDLLATLVATDPVPIAALIGTAPDRVLREVQAGSDGRRDRIDLVLERESAPVALVEVKVLSDLGVDQLTKYAAAFPEVERRFVLHLSMLPVHVAAHPDWTLLTWEDVLAAYADSSHPWVSATARAWLAQLHRLVPAVDETTVWNDVPDDPAGLELALRARVAWLAARMRTWCRLEQALGMSSGGGAWTAVMRTPSTVGRHQVIAEIQEGTSAQEWRPDPSRRYADRLVGPVVLVGLQQHGPDTSATFDWDHLHAVFRHTVLDAAGQPTDGRAWITTPAQPRNDVDKENWRRMVAVGAPRWLGKGYGMATARSHRLCAFGARLGLAPTMTLGQVDAELQALQELVETMAAVPAV